MTKTSRPLCAAASRRATRAWSLTEDENADRIKGVVHSNSLARAFDGEGPNARGAARQGRTDRSETKPLDDLLADLQRAGHRSRS